MGHSFLPSVIREWNNLPLDVRNSDSLNSFKRRLHDRDRYIPKYYYSGNRKLQILHTRLRTGCSSLNHDLFLKHITDSPLCRCGEIENTEHYFMSCRLYHNQRVDLRNIISRYTPVTLQIVLYGSNMLPLNINNAIFEAVHKYAKKVKDFNAAMKLLFSVVFIAPLGSTLCIFYFFLRASLFLTLYLDIILYPLLISYYFLSLLYWCLLSLL